MRKVLDYQQKIKLPFPDFRRQELSDVGRHRRGVARDDTRKQTIPPHEGRPLLAVEVVALISLRRALLLFEVRGPKGRDESLAGVERYAQLAARHR